MSVIDLKQHQITDNSIVIVKRPEEMDEEQFQEALSGFRDDILLTLNHSILIIGVDHWDDLSILSEEEMKEFGWVKAERVLYYKDTPFSEIAGDEEE